MAGKASSRDASALLQQADVVFRGRIRKVNDASAVEGAGTAAVRVEEVLAAADTFPDVQKREITLAPSAPTRVGEQALFFARSWFFGQGVGLVEVGRLSVKSLGLTRRLIQRDRERQSSRRMLDRVAGAILIVSGTVRDTRPAETARLNFDTEHDPEWWEAVIDIREVLKGRSDRRIVVLFPASTDEIWIDCPKFAPEQEGIFILRRNQQERGGPNLWAPGLTALDPRDYQPLQALDLVRSFLAKS